MMLQPTHCSPIAQYLVTIFVATCCFANPAVSQEGIGNAKEAFQKGSYPWYDAEADTANFEPEILIAGEAQTADRQTVKKAPSYSNRWQGPNITAWGWLSFWGILVLLVFAGLIGLVIWFLLKVDAPSGFGNRGESNLDDEAFGSDRVESLPFDLSKPTGDFRAAAEAAYLAGDMRSAVTYLFSYVLLTLDRNQKVRLRRGKTNRQYLTEMRTNGADSLTGYYERLMVSFESTFFGNHELDKSRFEESWSGLDEFQANLSRLDGVANA